MTETEENQIVESVLEGDREAFALLVDAYKGAIFNLAFRMTGSNQDADDLSQETFIRAYRNLRQFDPQKRFFTWIYTIGLNLIRNHLKKQEKRGQIYISLDKYKSDPFFQQTEQNMIRAQDMHRLEACLQMLPVDLREAVVLRFYQDLSFEEIAVISDASLSAVKMRVYRGLDQLKRLMQD